MVKRLCLPLLALALCSPVHPTFAQDENAQSKQHQEAEKERQQKRKARSEQLRGKIKSFKDFIRDLDASYDEKIQDAVSDFDVQQVDLRADRDKQLAEAQANYQKRTADLFSSQAGPLDAQAIKQLESEWRGYSDELFDIKKSFATAQHAEMVSRKQLTNQLLSERDREALEEAGNLGLGADIQPILATPIGDGLTRSEKQWNAKERDEVARLEARNLELIRDFKVGGTLRKWQMTNMEKDFELEWQEKQELHALESDRQFFKTVMMQAARGKEVDQKEISSKLAEIAKQSNLIRKKYDSIRKNNDIRRRDEKKKILAP
jgi:hypothetical protein